MYYRIITVDRDGHQSSSGVKSLTIPYTPPALITSLNPDPVCGNCDLKLDYILPAGGKISADVYSVQGARVQEAAWQSPVGAHVRQLHLNGLPAGIYSIVVRSSGASDRKVFIVR